MSCDKGHTCKSGFKAPLIHLSNDWHYLCHFLKDFSHIISFCPFCGEKLK